MTPEHEVKTKAMDSDDQLREALRHHLHPGENLRAAVLVSRPDGRTSIAMTRAEMSPFRLRFRRPELDGPGARRGVQGSPSSLAVGLDEHIRIVTHPRVLAATDRRLIVLAKRRRLFRPASGGTPQLRLLWECARTNLATATERAERLRLDFTDGSAVTLLTPAVGLRPFLAAVAPEGRPASG